MEREKSSQAFQYKYDAVVLLCGGNHRLNRSEKKKRLKWTANDTHELNFESKLKVAAMAEVFDQKLTPVIISSGGALWGAPPMGRLMAEALEGPRFKVPPEAVIEENETTDSRVQVEKILGIVKERSFKKVGVVADSKHLDLVVPLFKNYGLEVDGLEMEKIVIERNHGYKKNIDKLHRSWYWKIWSFKYNGLAKRLEKDPKLDSSTARLSSSLTKLMRSKWMWWFRLPGTA